jgi:hypothetical protein
MTLKSSPEKSHVSSASKAKTVNNPSRLKGEFSRMASGDESRRDMRLMTVTLASLNKPCMKLC